MAEELLPEQLAGSEAIDHFRAQLEKESDRAVVLISGAMLDEALRALLLTKLAPNSTRDDSLFDGANAPMNSFSAKIDLAYRIGLISARLCRDLHLHRKIRNDFAHRAASCSFEDQTTKSRIEEINKSHGIFLRSPLFLKKLGELTLRRQYVESVAWKLYFLNAERIRVSSFNVRHEEFGYDFSYDLTIAALKASLAEETEQTPPNSTTESAIP